MTLKNLRKTFQIMKASTDNGLNFLFVNNE